MFNCAYRALFHCLLCKYGKLTVNFAVTSLCNVFVCHGKNFGTYGRAKAAADTVAVYKKFHTASKIKSIKP